MLRLAIVSISMLLAGCQTRPLKLAELKQAQLHIVRVNKHGFIEDPDGTRQYTSRVKQVLYSDQLADNIVAKAPESNGVKRILIYIHGGLVTPESALMDGLRLASAEGCTNAYPISITWNSSLLSSYVDQTLFVRQGEVKRLPRNYRESTNAPSVWQWFITTPITAPMYLATDVARGVTRMPRVLLDSFLQDTRNIPGGEFKWRQGTEQRLQEARETMAGPPQQPLEISSGADFRDGWDLAKNSSLYVAGIPGRVVSFTALDIGGQPAWDNMQRRTKTLLHNSTEYADNFAARLRTRPSGGLGIFMDELLQTLGQDSARRYAITLVGHSMGSMVINEILNQFGTELPENVHFDNIVFMAGACSTRDFERCVIPYLRRQEQCNFFNLTLHPGVERKETWGAIVTRGSLLEWIDTFYTNPHTVPDRVIGKSDNFTRVMHELPQSVLGRIHFKIFSQSGGASIGRPLVASSQKDTAWNGHQQDVFMGFPFFPEWDGKKRGFGPQKHGEFNDLQFWEPKFWKPHPIVQQPQ